MIVAFATGCGAQTEESKFEGNADRAAVAKLVDDLAAAGLRKDAETICAEILAKQLVDALKAAGGDCESEMDRAIKDASNYDLQVTDVKVTGSTATARVRQGETNNVATFSFVKEKAGWRASALGG